MAKWDILICSVNERAEQLHALVKHLNKQITQQYSVNIIVLADNAEMSIGKKRNLLLEASDSEYVSFIDDDDMVTGDFIKTIYPKLTGVDYIGFELQHYWCGEKSKPTRHSLIFDTWGEEEGYYFRNVTHLNPIRRELAMLAKFPEKNCEEDIEWGQAIYNTGKVKTEHYIEKFMYHYYFDPDKSVALRRQND